MNRTLRVLVTGAGAPGIRGTLYALHKNPDGVALYTVGTDIKEDVIGRFLVNRFYKVPEPEDSSYIESLIKICRDEAIEVIIPQTTRESSVLSRYKENFLLEGIHIIVSDHTAMKVANNKWRLLQVFEKLKMPHPCYRLATSEDMLVKFACDLGYPERLVVVKPPTSSGMRGFRILREKAWNAQRFFAEKPNGIDIALEELLSILRRGDNWPELLVMEYLPGAEYSVDAFLGKKVSIAIPRLRKETRSGISFTTVLEYRNDIIGYTLEIGQYIGLQYAFGFQFKLDEWGIPKILECNPRVQGTMVASIFSGVNVVWFAVREVLGQYPNELPLILNSASFYRFWGGLGVWGDSTDEI